MAVLSEKNVPDKAEPTNNREKCGVPNGIFQRGIRNLVL